LAMSAMTSAILLAYNALGGHFAVARIGWRQQERDKEAAGVQENLYGVKPHKVRGTRFTVTALSLLLTLGLGIALCVFIVVLHQDHTTAELYSWRGLANATFDRYSDLPFTEAGWSARNTRFRYAWSAMGCLVVLANFLPWRSRVIAYIFAFFYFAILAMSIVQFALDVYEVRNAKRNYCPRYSVINGPPSPVPFGSINNSWLNCIQSPYVTVCIFDIFCATAIVVYLLNEYIIRYRSIHSQRKYPWFQIRKIETELDSRRPVRCELTSQPMTAKEYYYKHRFLTGPLLSAGVPYHPASDAVIPAMIM